MKKKIVIIFIICLCAVTALMAVLAVRGMVQRGENETSARVEATALETSVATDATTETTSETTTETTSEPATEAVPDIVNIAFLGIDWQENRSDVMMIVSFNSRDNKVSVISLLRDSKVNIEGCSVPTKLGYAYKWGGPDLILKTINENYGLDLQYYLCVWFDGMANIIDDLGGVDIELTEAEIPQVNSLSHALKYNKDDAVPGMNHLNGAQAVSYSRIRSIDSEYHRSKRQQRVIAEMFRILTNMDPDDYPEFISCVLENTESNIPLDVIRSFTKLDMDTLELYETTVPDPDFETDLWSGWEDVDHTIEDYPDEPWLDPWCWFWIYDLDKAGERIRGVIGE